MIEELPTEGPSSDEDDDAPSESYDVYRRPRAADGRSSAGSPADCRTFRQRHDSDLSLCSLCSSLSSGYMSWRSSTVTPRTSVLSTPPHDQEDKEPLAEEYHLQTVPEITTHHTSSSTSSSSSSSSFEEAEFQSCRSSSIESLSTNGSLPRGVMAGVCVIVGACLCVCVCA